MIHKHIINFLRPFFFRFHAVFVDLIKIAFKSKINGMMFGCAKDCLHLFAYLVIVSITNHITVSYQINNYFGNFVAILFLLLNLHNTCETSLSFIPSLRAMKPMGMP